MTIHHVYDLVATDPDFHPIDDAYVMVDYLSDEPVVTVSGAGTNLKITTLEDIPTAGCIAEEILGRDPKEEARVRTHALLAQAVDQMHRQTGIMHELNIVTSGFDHYDGAEANLIVETSKAVAEQGLGASPAPDNPLEQTAVTVHTVSIPMSFAKA